MKVLRWLSRPENEREPKTLEDLATEIGVRPATILKWRSRKLDALAAEEARMQLLEHLPEIYQTLVRQAGDGSPEHIALFLKITTGTPEKKEP